MKSQIVALAIVFAGLPALAWGQAPCGCNSRHASGVRPASYGAWADYEPAGYHGGGGCGSCGSCAPAGCNPCCRPLLCIIPNTVRKIGCVLDCILPRGPICCNTGCGAGCTSGCASCSGGVTNPFIDDQPMPAVPPKPAAQETRRQPTMRAPREYASAPASTSRATGTRPATKSVLTRAAQSAEQPVSRANHMAPAPQKPISVVKRTSATAPIGSESATQSSRRSIAIPHNPLR